MKEKLIGKLIRRERMCRQWSQEGLCKGICAVSYLSKIEQGKTQASPETVQLLMDRLGIVWHEDCDQTARACIDTCYDTLFSLDHSEYDKAIAELYDNWERYANGPHMLDTIVLRSLDKKSVDPILEEYDLTTRQNTLLLCLQNNTEQAVRLNPCPYTFYMNGMNLYESGHYPRAIEMFQQSLDLAAREGYVHVMLHARILLGNCYSNLMDIKQMLHHYRIAERIARAIGDSNILDKMQYNKAATELQLGLVEDAYLDFQKLREKSALALHKMAICCEKMGRKDEALDCLNQAEASTDDEIGEDTLHTLCAPVRFRLEHGDYLSCDAYGNILLSSFAHIRRNLPHGYALFHMPWVLEWYRSHRQYKQAMDLMSDFPANFRMD